MIYHETVTISPTDKVLIEVIDASYIKLTIKVSNKSVEYLDKRRIKAIFIDDKVYVDVEDHNRVYLKINELWHAYYITHIERIDDDVFSLYTFTRNKTSLFLLPLLGENRAYFSWNKYFVNAYLGRCGEIELGNLYLLYRFFNVEDYLKLEEKLKRHKLFVKRYDTDKNHTLFHFKLPEDKLKEIEAFKAGKYSLFAEPCKFNILSFHGYQKDSELSQVLFKSEKLRKQLELYFGEDLHPDTELYSIMSLEDEVLHLALT
jgi:hypothetical protein